ncbi:MAG: hypothetical protein OEU40_07230 [Gammaproteobacteria bacterium]|nr:hypothetical protein [Gammaproteobacteria bacterium]
MNKKYALAIGILLAVIAGCASAPEPLEVSDVEELEATVIAVNAESRLLVLRRPAGNEVALRAGPEVRNLPQVEVGDILRVSYYTGFVFSMAEPGNAGADAEIVAGRAEEGDRPGAMVGATMRQTVEILSIAPDAKAVSFRDADGMLQSIDVPREEGQAFARKLSPGDLVDIQYTEAVAIGVEAAE